LNIQNDSTGNIARDNILLDANGASGAIDLCATCGVTSDHNAVVGRFSFGAATIDLAGWRALTGNDAASFTAVDSDLFAAGTLALRAGSPAIDAGDPTGAPAVDIVGTPRPQGAGYDIGAYEYVVAGGSGSGSGSGSDPAPANPGSDSPNPPGSHGGCSAGGDGSAALALGLACALAHNRRRRCRASARSCANDS
jgi:uncharacterized protein (TIGR03382 family)